MNKILQNNQHTFFPMKKNNKKKNSNRMNKDTPNRKMLIKFYQIYKEKMKLTVQCATDFYEDGAITLDTK